MSIRQLRTLVAIAEHGSFAAAAEAINLTQSAVSVQIKMLESEFGQSLFDRTKRPPTLNEAGRMLVTQAREVVESYDRLRSGAGAGDAVEGRLRLGAVGSALTTFLPDILVELRARHPRLHVELASGLTTELVSQVDRGALDAAVASDIERVPSGLVWTPFLRQPLVLVAPPDAPDLSARELVSAYPFIRYAPRAAVGQVIEAAIRAARLKPREAMRLDWIEAVEAMVSRGLGVSVVPDQPRRASAPALKRLAFGSAPRFRTLGLVTRGADGGNPVVPRLLAALRQLGEANQHLENS